MSAEGHTVVDPADTKADGYAFHLDGDNVALDFANTVSRRKAVGETRDNLDRYGRLVSWAEAARLMTAHEGASHRKRASEQPRAAVTALRRAAAVREAIFSIFSAIAREKAIPVEALSTLDEALPSAFASPRIVRDGETFTVRFASDENDLAAAVIAPVVRGALDLLTSEAKVRVRECNSTTCAWLFLDRSKNGSRRWCDMKICGNRAKARRHYAKGKATPEG
ncbi:MAG TPA: ABATE domain-containing protein [Candidatus Polarisedimenticolaceae bacterium]|nr:ABATE domain-containing protein [Candidatus Polarisedimenticolaceae bacterium]